MNILKRLSFKNLFLNRKRTISTIFGIILSTALICATCTLGTSFRQSLIEGQIARLGYYHLKLNRLTNDDIANLKQNRDISRVLTVRQLGTSVLEGSENPDKPYTALFSMNQEAFEELKFHLSEGRFPENENEILISRHILTNGKLTCQIGDTITLNLGTRYLPNEDGELLDSDESYLADAETILDPVTRTYTIVGIMERPNYDFEPWHSACYTTVTCDENATGDITAYLTLKNPYHYKQTLCELFDVDDYSKIIVSHPVVNRYPDFRLNNDLLRIEVFSFSDQTIVTLITVLSIVIGIIMFSSIFCIRNSFAIATTERIRMYGMLASIGATKRQIRKNVIWEGMILGIVAVPLGVLSGLLADVILLKVVNHILGEALLDGVELVFSAHWLFLLLSAVLGFLTIYFSAISSARKASKVSPIAQLRNTQDIRLSARSLRIPKWVSACFHTGGVLAYKNLKRAKRKYRTTVISLAVSIFTFIAMNSFIENGFQISGNYFTDYDYNLMISASYSRISEYVPKILAMDHIEEAHILYCTDYTLLVQDKDKFLPSEYDILTDENGEQIMWMLPLALDDASFRLYCKKVGADYETAKTGGILYDRYRYYQSNGTDKAKLMYANSYSYKKGDTIHGSLRMIDEEGDVTKKEFSTRIECVTDVSLPYGCEGNNHYGGYLILDEAYADAEIGYFPQYLTIQSDDPDTLATEIRKQAGNAVNVRNLDEEARSQRSVILVVSIFLYGFITVITLIGVTNIFNTITSNMELRQREFAMLKSVGMTKKEFHRMIRLETVFYSAKALLYGVILGLLGSFAIYKAFSGEEDIRMYVPVWPIVISGIFVFLFVFAIMNYSMARINRQNVIETIRKENI